MIVRSFILLVTVCSTNVLIAKEKPDNGTVFVMGAGRSIFALTANGTLHEVPNWDTFVALGGDLSEVLLLEESRLQSYPMGESVQLPATTVPVEKSPFYQRKQPPYQPEPLLAPSNPFGPPSEPLAQIRPDNPFYFPFTPSVDRTGQDSYGLTIADYESIQRELRHLSVRHLDSEYYKRLITEGVRHATTLEDFMNRTSNGIRQHIISVKHGLLPQEKFTRFGNGSGDCLVSTAKQHKASMRGFLDDIPAALTEVGFNGHLLTLRGGYPNPTGEEARFAAVPYAFKVFMLVAARVKFGCRRTLWIDSALLPLKDPAPLFAHIARHGALVDLVHSPDHEGYIYPNTVERLMAYSGVRVNETKHVRAMVLGLDLDNPLAQSFVREYYALAAEGYGFFSCYPEEFVMAAVLQQGLVQAKEGPDHSQPVRPKYADLLVRTNMFRALLNPGILRRVKNEGCFFYQRTH